MSDNDWGKRKTYKISYRGAIKETIVFLIVFQAIFTAFYFTLPTMAEGITQQIYLLIGSTNILALYYVLVGFRNLEQSQPIINRAVLLLSKVESAFKKAGMDDDEVEKFIDDTINELPRAIKSMKEADKWAKDHKEAITRLTKVIEEIDVAEVAEAVKNLKPLLKQYAQGGPATVQVVSAPSLPPGNKAHLCTCGAIYGEQFTECPYCKGGKY